ncbi:MAG: hypothetical protein Q6M04_06900 [Thermostichus sp. BF3_bins_97]
MRFRIFAATVVTALAILQTLPQKPWGIPAWVNVGLKAHASEIPIPLLRGEWQITETNGVERWSGNRPELAGAVLFKRPESTSDIRAALLASLSAEGFQSIQVAAQHPVQHVKLLDQQGNGAAFIGTAQRHGQTVRFAATVLYGTLDGSPRVSTVYAFAAPESLSRRMGGWPPIAAAWLGLRANEVTHLLLEQGNAPSAKQAENLAAITDYFFADAAAAVGLYQFNLSNITNQFLSDYLCTGVVGVEDVNVPFGSSDC